MKRKYAFQKELTEVSTDFEQNLRTLANTPPLKLKDLKEELRKERKNQVSKETKTLLV